MVKSLQRDASRAAGLKGNLDWIEESLHKKSQTLEERVKELTCVYETIRLFRRVDLSHDEKLQSIAALIPSAMQYPDEACARIIENQKEFKTPNFDSSSQWKLSSGILAAGRFIGLVEVRYLKEFPKRDEGPFLNEEQALIRVLAETIGLAIENNSIPAEKNGTV